MQKNLRLNLISSMMEKYTTSLDTSSNVCTSAMKDKI